jgi:hypothetical protein
MNIFNITRFHPEHRDGLCWRADGVASAGIDSGIAGFSIRLAAAIDA